MYRIYLLYIYLEYVCYNYIQYIYYIYNNIGLVYFCLHYINTDTPKFKCRSIRIVQHTPFIHCANKWYLFKFSKWLILKVKPGFFIADIVARCLP